MDDYFIRISSNFKRGYCGLKINYGRIKMFEGGLVWWWNTASFTVISQKKFRFKFIKIFIIKKLVQIICINILYLKKSILIN